MLPYILSFDSAQKTWPSTPVSLPVRTQLSMFDLRDAKLPKSGIFTDHLTLCANLTTSIVDSARLHLYLTILLGQRLVVRLRTTPRPRSDHQHCTPNVSLDTMNVTEDVLSSYLNIKDRVYAWRQPGYLSVSARCALRKHVGLAHPRKSSEN